MVKEGRHEEALARVLELARRTSSSAELGALTKLRKKIPLPGPSTEPVKIALLGTGTTDLMHPAITLLLEAAGVACELHPTEYNTYAREILDPNSGTNQFRPDVAVIVNSPAMLPTTPAPHASGDEVKAAVDELSKYWLDLAAKLHATNDCDVVLDNYHPIAARPLGNLGAKHGWDTNNFLTRTNLAIAECAPAYVHVHDVATLAARDGVSKWHDERYWYTAKLPVSLACMVAYVRSMTSIVASLRGRSAKCLVLDLDNTMWGGVVGDDGVAGIKIGQGDAIGEAHLAFQRYVKQLEQRGVMLAVCSKNEEANALAPFEERPEMVIKRGDILSFKANWIPKPENIAAIAQELNIGLDALVFVDDNPAEREHVRQRLPQVRVVELTDDPADYVRLLDETGWFEITKISSEDKARTDQYKANAERAQLQESALDYDAYLASLEQVGVVKPYEDLHLDRISQLINKSNQFNLTTRRQSRSAVEAEMNDENRLTAYVRLKDRFGDNGLISVFSSLQEGDTLRIDQWLMSCRVFARGVEQLLFNTVVERAAARGVTTIFGTYIPTAKNGLVKDLFERLGFEAHDDGEDGTTHWRLSVADFKPFDVKIEVVDEY